MVYSDQHYKEFLKNYLKENNYKGIVTDLAKKCGCDRTYLSQVINGKAELTTDHMLFLCQNLSLTEDETAFMMLRLMRDRSSLIEVRNSLNEKIKKILLEHNLLSKKVKTDSKYSSESLIKPEFKISYYSEIHYGLIHIMTSTPHGVTINEIYDRLPDGLKISKEKISEIVDGLAANNLIIKQQDRYKHKSSDLYLDIGSPLNYTNHLNWRIKAAERHQTKQDIHYTNVFSVSKKDVAKLRFQIIELIKDQRKQISESGSEDVCVFCCDFFKV